MNHMLDKIKSWKIIRKFIDKQVGDEVLKSLLNSGADILNNTKDQIALFTVIQSKKLINEINHYTKKDMKRNCSVDIINRLGRTSDFDIFYGAPTVIMVSVKDKSKIIGDVCNEAIRNIIKSAKSLGLSVTWNSFVQYHFTNNSDSKVKKELDIPAGFTPYYAISLGYAN